MIRSQCKQRHAKNQNLARFLATGELPSSEKKIPMCREEIPQNRVLKLVAM
jgi:hypothetical protein